MDRIELGLFEATGRFRFDQLTSVRNHVRSRLKGAHEVVGATVDVVWSDGSVETLVFNDDCGYPVGDKDWMAEWVAEATTNV